MSPLLLHSNTNQYKINGLLCTYTEMFCIQTCCNHILSAAEGFQGQEATCADPGIFVSFIKSSDYLTVPEAAHYFPGGGVANFFHGGYQMLISIETHIRTCYFPGGVSGPPIPFWICTRATAS